MNKIRLNKNIEISVESLINSQFERIDMPYQITDELRMVKWIEKYCEKNGDKFYDPRELDIPINEMFDHAYESGESWLCGAIFENNLE